MFSDCVLEDAFDSVFSHLNMPTFYVFSNLPEIFLSYSIFLLNLGAEY